MSHGQECLLTEMNLMKIFRKDLELKKNFDLEWFNNKSKVSEIAKKKKKDKIQNK